MSYESQLNSVIELSVHGFNFLADHKSHMSGDDIMDVVMTQVPELIDTYLRVEDIFTYMPNYHRVREIKLSMTAEVHARLAEMAAGYNQIRRIRDEQ